MKKISKVVVSILLISILTTSVLAASGTDPINGLKAQVKDLINRVTNLEKDPYPAEYFSLGGSTGFNQTFTWTLIAELTIDLPKPANVYIEPTGEIYGWDDIAGIKTNVDNLETSINWYGRTTDGWTAFQSPIILRLDTGHHNIQVFGQVFGINSPGSAAAYSRINVIAYDPKGNVEPLANNKGLTTINKIQPAKK